MDFRKLFSLAPVVLILALSVMLTGCDDEDDPLDLGSETSSLRVAHLSPDAPNVDVRVDGSVVLSDVPFKAVSGYLTVPAGPRRIQITPTGVTSPVVIDATVDLVPNRSVTVAATGLLGSNDLQPLVLSDDRTPDSSSDALVRFVHTAPDAPAVDVAVTNGPVLFSNVSFRGFRDYLQVAGGRYDLEVRVAGTSNVVLNVPNAGLFGGVNFTIFAVGQVSDGSLSALVVQDS